MKQFTLRAFTLLLIFGISSFVAQATHLMGGNMYYQYNGLGPNGYEYHVTLKIYRSCAQGSSQLPASMDLGVYDENPALPNANKILVLSVSMPLTSQQFITPPNANDSCTFLPNVCVEEGVYEVDISLPASIGGYQLISERCCRNSNIANLFDPLNAAMAWYAFIPPTATINSSPVFTDAPVPFICTGDTISVLNSASDPDGDDLIYSFVIPFNGSANGGNPNPPPPNVYTWPITDVTYLNGTYSVTDPFGPGGYANIDSLTGLTSYLSSNQGFYVVAVEIREYRNGVLVGITRRDLQLIFIPCPVNPAPVVNNTQFTYTINEGQSLCFNVSFTDPNSDSLYMSHSGDIFNSSLTNPPATLTDVNGIGNITSQFCWNTTCEQGRNTPYQFSVTATDNGCPAKVTNAVFTINVVPFHGAQNINGPDTICGNGLSGIQYTTTGQPNSTFNWTLLNGTQVSGGTTNTITVNWNATGPYSITVNEVNALGCHGDTISLPVAIAPLPTANAGTDHTFCSGSSATLGVASVPGLTYLWSPTTGLSSSTVSNPTLTLTNTGANPVTYTYIVNAANYACSNNDTVVVTVNPAPVSNAGNNQILCNGNTVTIGAPTVTGYSYSWSPPTGMNNTTISNPTVTLSTAPDTIVYTVITTNTYNCTSSDNVQIIVSPLPTVNATANPLTICAGQQVTLTGTGATTYSWATTVNPGTPIGTGSLLLVNPTVTTSYIVTGTNGLNCSNKDTVTITVNALPNVVATSTPDSICVGDSVILSVSGGNTFSWALLSNPGVPIGTGNTITVSPIVTTSYIVTGTTTLTGCENKDTITVFIVALPVSNAGSDQPLCSGNTITLGTSTITGYSYQWTPATGLSSTTVSNPTLVLTNNGNTPDTLYYTVVTSNAFGCTSRDSVRVIVNPVPTANAGTDVIFCSGQSAQIGTILTTGYTYLWSPITGLSSSTASDPTITLTNAGTTNDTLYYIVTATWFTCIDKDTIRVIVKPLPLANAGPDQTFCSGDTVQLGTTSTLGYTYVWTPPTNLNTTTASDPIAILTSVGGPTTYTYTVTTTWNGCTTVDSTQITINNLPTVVAAAFPSAICIGGSASLTAGGATTYSWALASNPGVSIGTGSPFSVSPTVTTTYIVTGTSSVNCDNTTTVTVTVNPLPTVTATAPSDSICYGDSILLTGNGATSYSWALLTNPGNPISGNPTVYVAPIVATSYIVTGTDGNGCENKDTFEVFVNPAATLTAIFGVDYACPGVMGVPYWVLNPTPGSTYTWSVTGGILASGQGTDSVTIDWGLTGTGVITVVESTDHGCLSDPVTFSVNINPILNPPAPNGLTPLCANEAQNIIYSTLNTPSSVYTWGITGGTILSGQGTSTITVSWDSAGVGTLWFEENSTTIDTVCYGLSDTLIVTINPVPQTSAITGPTQLCQNDSTSLSVLNTTGSNYQWTATGGTIVSGQNSNSIGIVWNTSGSYSVYVIETNSFGCVGDTVPFNILINPLPVANAGPDVAICFGDHTQLNASGGTNYQWTPPAGLGNTGIANPNANPDTTTTYIVTVSDNNACSATASVVVTVNPLPIVNAGPDVDICIGDSVQLNVTPTNASYVWSPPAGLSNINISNPFANPTLTTMYTVVVTDGNSCTAIGKIKVKVHALPVVTASGDKVICSGDTITIYAYGATSYSWTPTTDLSDPNIQTPIAQPTATTTYIVVGTNGNGCSDTADVTVTVNPQPTASFTYTDTANCEGIEVQFTNTSTDGLTYVWNFGDGSQNSVTENPIHTYLFGSNPQVTLNVHNNQCHDKITLAIPFGSISSYLGDSVPNVFTPNGDGINDCYDLSSLGDFAKCIEFRIFDRWGRLIYSSSDKKGKCWDGEDSHGNPLPEATYIYIIDVLGQQLKGTLMLIR